MKVFMEKSNNRLEKETIKTLNSENQINPNSAYRTFQDDNSSKNCPLSTLLNEIYKNNPDNNKLLSEVNKYDNFHCSGKFNVLQTNSNNIPNGGNENYDNNDDNSLDNNKDLNNNANGGNYLNKSKNEFGFTSFKSFFDNNNKDNNIDNNKDNNTNNSTSQKVEESNDKDNGNKIIKKNFESNGQNKDLKYEQNIGSMGKEKNNNDQNSSLTERNVNYSERYNNFSHYSDSINNNEDYLNYESNYSNSNKREETRDIRSLYHEESEDN